MLPAHRLRRRPNNKSTLGQCLVSVVIIRYDPSGMHILSVHVYVFYTYVLSNVRPIIVFIILTFTAVIILKF